MRLFLYLAKVVRLNRIEEVFLYTLREDNPREEINNRIKYFRDDQWQALYNLARDTYLYPIFYNRLLILKLDHIPHKFLARLRNLYLLNLKRNIQLEREISRIIRYFGVLSIPVMPIKGPVLARYLYNDVGLRQASCDLDILIKDETINQAKEKLKELGYEYRFLEKKRDFLHPVDLSRQIEQIVFARSIDSDSSFILDLHWCIRGFFNGSSIQKLWENAEYFALDGHNILMPSHEDHLIYLSLISISPLDFVQLKYIYDIHRLVTVFKKALNWEELLDKTRKLNLENCLYFPLNLSKNMFSTDIPNVFLEKLSPAWLIRRLINHWINEKSVLAFKQKPACSYPLRCLLGRYFYSGNTADFLRKSFRKALD